jgi:DNA-directed RNA polymerase sigma subunit (sigma70/sigma32)
MQIADLSDDDPLKFYLRELATVQLLTSDETTGLLKQMRSGSDRAEHAEKRLIEANLIGRSHCRTIPFGWMSNAGFNPEGQ